MSYFQGQWQNIYNSLLTLNAGDGDYLYGNYSSTTGSSGTYYVAGYGSLLTPTQQNGVGITLSLFWRSYTPGTEDPSWHWVSGFGGQGILDAQGNPTISLNHMLVATDDFPGLAPVGTYADKLIYTPYPSAAKGHAPADHRKRPGKRGPIADPIDGTWVCASPRVSISLTVEDWDVGWVTGRMSVGGAPAPLVGFVDTRAQTANLAYEGITVASYINGQYVCLCGRLDLARRQIDVLRLVSGGTASNATYVQTSVQGFTLVPG